MRIHLFSPSPIMSASGGCCILNSVMISPTTRTKWSRSSTNCSRSPWPRKTSWLMTVSRSPGTKVSFSTTRNPYICMPSDAAAFCRSYKTLCCCCTNLVLSPRSRQVTYALCTSPMGWLCGKVLYISYHSGHVIFRLDLHVPWAWAPAVQLSLKRP